MVYEIRYTPRARADLEAIFSYLDARNPAAAHVVKRQIERFAAALALLPYLGGVIDRSPEFRSLRAGRYPYRMYYRIRDHEVWMFICAMLRGDHGQLRGY